MNSIKTTARVAGVLYLIIFVFAIFSNFFVLQGLVESKDATATAENILANEGLFRMGFGGFMIVFLADVAVSILFYILLEPVSKMLSLMAASFRLVMSAIFGASLLNWFMALLLLRGDSYLTVFETGQLYALVLLFLKAFNVGFNIGIIFFGFHCLCLGYLIFKANYFPNILGILMMVAGFGYVVDSFSIFLIPNYNPLFSAILLVPAVIAEASLTIWLMVKGIDVEKWEGYVTP